MKVKIITRHAPINYGSVLQSLATVKVVEAMGHDARIIDYQRKDECGLRYTLEQLKQKKEFKGFLRKILYVIVRYPEEKIAQLRFHFLRQRYLKMTPRYSTREQLFALSADVFMSGSDQLWRTVTNGCLDDAYFLRFVKKGKKIAYSSSFGKSVFSKEEMDLYREWLSSYNGIAVREDNAVDIIKELGIASKLSILEQVLDPVLLLSDAEWGRMIHSRPKREYVLIYQIHNDARLDNYARNVAKKMNLPLLKICTLFHQKKKGEKMVLLPDLNDFLALIKNCRCLITDSFHGTCFALLFKKNFMEFLPLIGTASRNQSLLRLFGLEDRIVSGEQDFSLVFKDIDYIPVEQKLDQERLRSLEILKRLIEN